jgi:glycosyltransferase involved in cell wall biosynthesis
MEECLMRILNVNSSLGLKTGGGTAERTFQMSRFLARQRGVQCTVLALDIELDAQRIEAHAPAKVVVLPCLWKRFYVPQSGQALINRLVADADVIHLMGHWSVLNTFVYWAARRANKPYVVCPAGALPIFGRSAILKRLYNFAVGKAIIQNAVAWIAVTSGELPHFESYGVPTPQVTVIPNGVNEEDFPLAEKQEFLSRHNLPDVPMILFMGRLNPIKGPDLLLQAFIQARHQFADVHLVFAGPDGGMLSALITTAEQAGVSEYVHFIGYVSGDDKSAAYRCAKLLVVPSRQEAMSIVALEAGICGTSVLLTDQCGFSDVRLVDSRLEVPATVSGIADGLSKLLVDSAVLLRVAPAWRDFVAQRYAWGAIVLEYLNLYKRICTQQVSK